MKPECEKSSIAGSGASRPASVSSCCSRHTRVHPAEGSPTCGSRQARHCRAHQLLILRISDCRRTTRGPRLRSACSGGSVRQHGARPTSRCWAIARSQMRFSRPPEAGQRGGIRLAAFTAPLLFPTRASAARTAAARAPGRAGRGASAFPIPARSSRHSRPGTARAWHRGWGHRHDPTERR